MTVEIYGRTGCVFCTKALNFCLDKAIEYRYYNYTDEPEKKDEMMSRNPGARTVPQVFINGEHVGGYNELVDHFKVQN